MRFSQQDLEPPDSTRSGLLLNQLLDITRCIKTGHTSHDMACTKTKLTNNHAGYLTERTKELNLVGNRYRAPGE